MSKISYIDHMCDVLSHFKYPSQYWKTTYIGFKELDDSKEILQKDGKSVFDHTMLVMDVLTIKNKITLLAALFHDLGKSYVKPVFSKLPYKCSIKFPNHAIESAKIAQKTMIKWGATNDIIDRVVRIVSMHMYDIKSSQQHKTIRKFVANVGCHNIEDWFTLRIADSRGYLKSQEYINNFIGPFKDAVMSYIDQQPGTNESIFTNFETKNGMQIEGGNC